LRCLRIQNAVLPPQPSRWIPRDYREGWEEVLFLLMFLAIWQLASVEPAGDF
jgi:hypothetical protein